MQELNSNQIMPSNGYSGMPKANNGMRDLSEYAAKLDELEQLYVKERYKRVRIYTEISNAIELVDNEDERTILTLRYIKGMDWEDIMMHEHYSWRTMHRIYARALKK